MELKTRQEQFEFFLDLVSLKHRKSLRLALKLLADTGYANLSSTSAFEICPFNDSHEQILRGLAIYEGGKRTELFRKIANLIEEYVFLVSDFVPPCCGDGRTFYERADSGVILLVCDRCQSSYDLDGRLISKVAHKKMDKSDFIEQFGKENSLNWPFREKVKNLVATINLT